MSVELRPDDVLRLLELDRKFAKEGLTFDDVLLVPAESHVLPNDVSTRTRLTRSIELSIPIVSAAMDTVTDARLAIALAREGGLGIVHRNLPIEDQVSEVDKVKRSEAGMIVEPVTLPPDALVRDALELMAHYKVSGIPITDEHGILVGILTNRDLRFEDDVTQPVSALMTARNLVTAPVGTTLAEAEEILHRHKIEKLPVVDADGKLRGLITVKDIQKKIQYPQATKDDRGRLRVGAAVGVGPDAVERAQALVAAGVDVLVVDTAHGHSHRRDRDGAQDQGRNLDRRHRRQHRDGGGGAGADRRGRRRRQVRDRARGDLHDARRRGRRRPAGDRDLRRRAGGGARRDPGRRRRRPHVVRRHREGDRSRRRRRDDRLDARRHRRGAGRRRRLTGRAVQGVPRHGLARRDEGARLFEGPVLPERHRGRRQARAGGDRGPRSLQGAARADRPPARRRPAAGDGVLRRARRSRT